MLETSKKSKVIPLRQGFEGQASRKVESRFFMRDFLILCGVILVDQGAKAIFIKHFSQLVSYNQNVGFDLSFLRISPKITSSIILVILLAIYIKFGSKIKILPLVLIFSGAFTNLADRFFRAGVVDFINLKIWPSFNLADLFIVLGVLLICLELLKQKN